MAGYFITEDAKSLREGLQPDEAISNSARTSPPEGHHDDVSEVEGYVSKTYFFLL